MILIGGVNISFDSLNVKAVNVALNVTLKHHNCSSLIGMNKDTLYYNKTHYCSSCKLLDPLGIPVRRFMSCGCAAWKPWKSHTCSLLFSIARMISGPEILRDKRGIQYRKLIMVSAIFAVLILCAVVGTVLRWRHPRRKNPGKRIKFCEESMASVVMNA